MKIIGTGSDLPSKSITNDMLAEFLDTNDEWISTRTGMRARRIRTTETLTDLAVAASKGALESSKVSPDDIDFVICSNVGNNFVTPNLGSIIQAHLGLHAPSFDLNAACTGFMYALQVADSFIKSGAAHKVLIVAAEEPAHFNDWTKRDTTILFGDGAGAVVVSDESDDLMSLCLGTVPNRDVIVYRRRLEPNPFEVEGVDTTEPLKMNGREVFRMAVESSQKDLHKVLDMANIIPDQIDYYILHQANARIINSIREHLGQPEEKMPQNIQNYGNTSSASIPILLDEVSRAGKLEDGMLLAFSAFGAGFTSGAAVLRWHKINY